MKSSKANSYYVYVLSCADGTFYTGKANDLDARIQVHNSGKGAKYTRSRLPVRLAHVEEYATHREAAQRECEIKRLTRVQKKELVKGEPDLGNV